MSKKNTRNRGDHNRPGHDMQSKQGEAAHQPPREANGKKSGSEERDSQATQIVRAVTLKNPDLFHTAAGDPYATVPVGTHRETLSLRSREGRGWVYRTFLELGKTVPSAHAVDAAIHTLEAKARFDGPEHDVHVRVGGHQDEIWLDLGDAEHQAVQITPGGWNVAPHGPVRFRRPRGILPLPSPERGGSIDDLRPFVNVVYDGFVLLVAWLLAALRPTGPYPILAILAEQGAAKSTLTRVIRRCLDPHQLDVRRPPRSTEDLMIGAATNHIVALDNVSSVPAWLSDDLAAIATGVGLGKRELYSNADEYIVRVQRPIILNGIGDVITRPDLLDRTLIVEPPTISDANRLEEATFWASFERAHPQILGALLDAAVMALRRRNQVQLPRKPRMADFAVWIVAGEPALPWPEGRFMEAHYRSRETALDVPLDGNPVGDTAIALAPWTGTATEFLIEMNLRTPHAVMGGRDWFRSGRQVSDALRRLVPVLRERGIVVRFGERESHTRRRLILITRAPGGALQPPDMFGPTAKAPRTGGIGDAGDAPPPPLTPLLAPAVPPPSSLLTNKRRKGRARGPIVPVVPKASAHVDGPTGGGKP